MPQGRVKKLVLDRGFVFIEGDRGTDLFFHVSALKGATIDELREGQLVEYVVGHGPKGPRAESVRIPLRTV
jgi:CspA family cold shock protein